MLRVYDTEIESTDKILSVFPDVASFNATILMADGAPAFLLGKSNPLSPADQARLADNGWTILGDRMAIWREPTISVRVLRQLFPDFGAEHIRRDVAVPQLATDDLRAAFDAYVESTAKEALEATEAASADKKAFAPKAKRASKAVASEAVGSAKIQDAGKKIGGARKDRATRMASLAEVAEEIEGMSLIEITDDVKKRTIWPFNVLDAVKEGVPVKNAILIRELISHFPTWNARIQVLLAKSDGRPDEVALQYLRRSAAEYAQCLLQFKQALLAVAHTDEISLITRAAATSLMEVAQRIHPVCESESLKNAMLCRGKMGRRSWFAGYKLTAYEVEHNIVNDAAAEAVRDDDWRVAPVDYIAAHDKKSKKSADETPVELDAAALAALEIKKDSRPHLAQIKREGLPTDRVGDVSPDDFINTFGFRAVEFGNWLPNDERQDVLNKAYDAFCTLSLVTGIPVEDIGLKGIYRNDGVDEGMALAFGARGTGGRGAAMAHFEPGRVVMNLTRMNGAGSLAHEYGHALDMFLGILADRADYKHNRTEKYGHYLTGRFAAGSGIFPLRNHRSDAAWLENAYRLIRSFVFLPVPSEQRAREDFLLKHKRALTKLLARGLPAEKRAELIARIPDNLYELPREVYTAITHEMRGRGARFGDLALSAAHYLSEDYAAMSNNSLARQPSLYRITAVANDLLRSKSSKYYVSAHEMFARAFEAMVLDGLKNIPADKNGRDDYLVYGTEDGGTRYPMAQERQLMNGQLRQLCADVARLIDAHKQTEAPVLAAA